MSEGGFALSLMPKYLAEERGISYLAEVAGVGESSDAEWIVFSLRDIFK